MSSFLLRYYNGVFGASMHPMETISPHSFERGFKVGLRNPYFGDKMKAPLRPVLQRGIGSIEPVIGIIILPLF